MENVSNYYESIDEASRFSRNSRKIEFLTTTHMLKGIVSEGACILDVGAGAGVYSFYYAERNHRVVAIDITPKHIEKINEKSLKKGGYLAIAYINKYSVIPMLATRDPKFIRNSVIEKVLNEGVIVEGDKDCFWTDAYFTSPDEIEAYLTNFDIIPVDHVGTDGISHTVQEYVDRLGDDEFDSWLSYHYQTCRERSILGISTHGLYICQKR